MGNRIVSSYGNGVAVAMLLLLGSSPTLAEEPIDRPASSGAETGQATRRWVSSKLLNRFWKRKDEQYLGPPSAVLSTPPVASELHRAQEEARDLRPKSPISGIKPPADSLNISPSEPGPREPGPELSQLGLAASAPAIAGGEPLLSGQDAESLEFAATEDSRSLLMKVLRVPEDPQSRSVAGSKTALRATPTAGETASTSGSIPTSRPTSGWAISTTSSSKGR
jgi:hypothetical protein